MEVSCFTLKNCEIKFKKYQYIFMAIIYFVGFIYYFWSTYNRQFVYYWDYSNYLCNQYYIEEVFSGTIIGGFIKLISSLKWDYTYILTIFAEFPFRLTSYNGDGYAFSQVLYVFPQLVILISALIIKIGNKILQTENKKFFCFTLVITSTLPVLHHSALLAMPDWFGVILCLMIVLNTMDDKLQELNVKKLLMLAVITVLLLYTRRWYLYFAFSYYAVYMFSIVMEISWVYKIEKIIPKSQIKNMFIFAFSIVISLIILCEPIWVKTLRYDYGKNYYSYMQGGFLGEIINQIKILGVILCVIILIAIIYGLIKRTEVILSFECLIAIIIAVFMFTRIQNMGSHQTLLLVPYYIILTIIGTAFLFKSKYKNLIHLFLFIYVALTLIFNYTGHMVNTGYLLSNQDNVVYDREDYDEIKNLSDWILKNTGDDRIYIIPHSSKYNPDVFRNAFLPNQKLRDKISYGSGIIGTHYFPTKLFDNQYVLTCVPFPDDNEMPKACNKQFLLNIKQYNNFKIIKKFDMGNGTEFILYKRIKKCSLAEIEKYKNALPPKTKDFPKLYEKYILKYISENNIKK